MEGSAPAGGDMGSRTRRCGMAERGGSPEFEFSQVMVVSFQWGLFLRDYSGEGNSIMLTLIGRGRQPSLAMMRQLGWLQVSSCTASNGVLFLRIGSEPS
jgi:hypothetical protein